MIYTVYVLVGDVEYPHNYVFENDARYQMAEWQGQGYECRLEVTE